MCFDDQVFDLLRQQCFGTRFSILRWCGTQVWLHAAQRITKTPFDHRYHSKNGRNCVWRALVLVCVGGACCHKYRFLFGLKKINRYVFLHLTTTYSGTFGKGWMGRGCLYFIGLNAVLVVFCLWGLTCMHYVYLALWTCKVLGKSFYVPYINFNSSIKTKTKRNKKVAETNDPIHRRQRRTSILFSRMMRELGVLPAAISFWYFCQAVSRIWHSFSFRAL